MKSQQHVRVDQALFGYSDGHRQLAGSIRLPSKDQYLLSAATDLATGLRLDHNDSYLTGLPLPESHRYAVIRTWSASEMPRPGCVWSHVLLLNARALSTYANLSGFLNALTRPRDATDRNFYSEQLTISPQASFAREPDRQFVADVIARYYSGEQVLIQSHLPPCDVDNAIFSIWSQQWPHLRMTFSFRTAVAIERRKSDFSTYDVQITNESIAQRDIFEADWPEWVNAATFDAAANEVTPLRRFLWRYGRDLATPRLHFRALVEFYLAVQNAGRTTTNEAVKIFSIFHSPSEAEILKRDILGVGTSTPSLFPPLEIPDLLGLLNLTGPHPVIGTTVIRERLRTSSAAELDQLSRIFAVDSEYTTRWKSPILDALALSADSESLRFRLPKNLRKLVLLSRPDLIDSETVHDLSDQDLFELLNTHPNESAARTCARAIVRRDMGRSNRSTLKAIPALLFQAAIEAQSANELNSVWTQVFRENVAEVMKSEWYTSVRSTSELTNGFKLLAFPKRAFESTESLARTLVGIPDNAVGTDRLYLLAYFLAIALDVRSSASWQLLAYSLPELRPLILQNVLQNNVWQMLYDDLPRFNTAESWDLNKRILIALSQLFKMFSVGEQTLVALGLKIEDLAAVFHAADEEEKAKKRIWWF